MREKTDWQELAAKTFCILTFCAGAYFFAKHLLPALFPLVSAFAVAFFVSRAAERLSRLTGAPAGLWAFVILSVALGVALLLALLLFRVLIGQISSFILGGMESGFFAVGQAVCLLEGIPFVGELICESEEYAEQTLRPLLTSALSGVATLLGGVASRALRATPTTLLSAVVGVICTYYMSVDFERICGFVKRLLPKKAQGSLSRLSNGALKVGARYLRAYLTLFLITFSILAAGLFAVSPRYALVLALIIAAIDVLPVFGAGLVLVPWSVISFISGEAFSGAWLLALYLAVALVRQIAEPRLIGKSMGMHPLGALLCMYFGYRLLGVAGMLFAPAAVSVALVSLGDKRRAE